jgi:hypothetical protein
MSSNVVFKSLTDERPVMIAQRKAAHILSTSAEDRDGDTINPDGWMLDDYRKNPVVLWAHDLKSLPIGRGENVAVSKGALRGTTVFPEAGVYPLADQVAGLVAGGFLRGVSVGFTPVEATPRGGRSKGVAFRKQMLYEYSLLPIPSNAEALTFATEKGLRFELVRPAFEALADGGAWFGVPETERVLVQKALSYASGQSTVRLGRGASAWARDESKALDVMADRLREGAREAAREAVSRGADPEEAVAAFASLAAENLAGRFAGLEADRLAATTVAVIDGERVSAADVAREVTARVHEQARGLADRATGRSVGGDGSVHPLGEASTPEAIDALRGA